MRTVSVVLLIALVACALHAQPAVVSEGVRFTVRAPGARSVSLVGDFNGWSKGADPMVADSVSVWAVVRPLGPGAYQYKFLVDGDRYQLDAGNPATADNYNRTARNSVFVLTEDRTILLTAEPPGLRANPDDRYNRVPGRKPVYLNIIWHQHQPLYVNPDADQLTGPWVRTHATKDYYDMAAMLRAYPDIHCTINLTSSLLQQLGTYYVDRLGPFVDRRRNRVDVQRFWKQWKGKTDPWIDLALKPTAEFDNADKDVLYRNAWNAFGTNDVMLERFPEYLALRQKVRQSSSNPYGIFSEQEMREIKFWFYLANFDPDFLLGPVVLPDRSVCDLTDIIRRGTDGTFTLRRRMTEDDCNRIVAEAVKVMAGIVPIHRELRFDPATGKGQIEIITTPYDHPILPLIYDSDLARVCQPADSLPPRFSFPEDAAAQVTKGVEMFRATFGGAPTGMWPGEGALAQPVLGILRSNGILWTATDEKNLARSEPQGQPNQSPVCFPAGNGETIAVVFRNTDLSDRIGFKYQNYEGEQAAEDFVRSILSYQPPADRPDVLITVILDGENAWEWYRYDMDGKKFLNALYRKLSRLGVERRIVTVTPTEYLKGNPGRTIPAHTVESLPHLTSLWPGSWINANFDTWIGEKEENDAWAYLLRARSDLGASGVPRPDPHRAPPARGTAAWNGYMAWEEMYAAEGSDWFWWYGDDQTAPGGDRPFDLAYITHLRNIYRFANLAGAHLSVPPFAPLIADQRASTGGQGTMARSRDSLQALVFTCDASAQTVPVGIFIAGNLPQLGDWTPNLIALHDDGEAGDAKSGDGIWSLTLQIPVGREVEYKYTNSGMRGSWIPGEEFPSRNRRFSVRTLSPTPIIIHDTFGK